MSIESLSLASPRVQTETAPPLGLEERGREALRALEAATKHGQNVSSPGPGGRVDARLSAVLEGLSAALAAADGAALSLPLCQQLGAILAGLEGLPGGQREGRDPAVTRLICQSDRIKWRFLNELKRSPESIAKKLAAVPTVVHLAYGNEVEAIALEAQRVHQELRSTFPELKKRKEVAFAEVQGKKVRVQAIGRDLRGRPDFLVSSKIDMGSFGKFLLLVNDQSLAAKKLQLTPKPSTTAKKRVKRSRLPKISAELMMADRAGSALAAVDQFRIGNDIYLVMPLQAGTLERAIKDLTPEQKRLVGPYATRQLLYETERLRALGLAHADIKPANIVVDAEGEVRLADFGLASAVGADGKVKARGTSVYMAPECLHKLLTTKDGAPWPRVAAEGLDTWSLAVTMAEFNDRDGAVLFDALHWSEIYNRQLQFMDDRQDRAKRGEGPLPELSESNSIHPRLVNALADCFLTRPSPSPTAQMLASLDPIQAEGSAAAAEARKVLQQFYAAPAYAPALQLMRAMWAGRD